MNNRFNQLTTYETMQVQEIETWKSEEPSVIGKSLGMIVEPMAWLVKKAVPEKAILATLDLANSAGQFMTDKGDILREGDVQTIAELKHKDLQLSDNIADKVHNWAIGMASAEGIATGIAGLPGMAVDIPTTIILALRTIHKIGACYGYESSRKEDNDFILAILSASSANTTEEKAVALLCLKNIEQMLKNQTWRGMEKVAVKQIGKEAGVLAIRNIAKQLGVNLTKRKALGVIPFIGAGINGSVNGWYIKEIGWSARRAFQERWLVDNQKIIDI